MILISVRGSTPIFGNSCFFAPNATLIGDVVLGNNCSVWFSAVVRGDVNYIRIGHRVNIQDGAVIHGTYKTAHTLIGHDVSIGHNAIVHGCTIEEKVLIGMGSIIMDHCHIGTNSIIGAGAVLPRNTIVPPGSVYGGIPAKLIKMVDQDLLDGEIKRIAQNYITYASWFDKEKNSPPN
ncbi:MAG: gamma carbonic anhydrase family protein [Flavobacteriaceae bacterium]|nr:gamma carbonic anhydrase family protein [Flavobacteriaceae bacterium]